MFICIDCHKGNKCSLCGGPCVHDFRDSFGSCEVCKKRTGCADCRHHHVCPEIRRRVEASTPKKYTHKSDHIPMRPDLV